MNLAAELVGWFAFLTALATGVIIWFKRLDWRAELEARKTRRAAGWLEFTRRQDFQRLLEQQGAAIDQAIAVIEISYPDFPADVRDQLLAAHEAAGGSTIRRNH